MNGTLLINSKNPFRYQGLSVQIKQGAMHVDGKYRSPSMYTNWNVRWAQKIGEKFAFKFTTELINANVWALPAISLAAHAKMIPITMA
jgi:hypothetical protein